MLIKLCEGKILVDDNHNIRRQWRNLHKNCKEREIQGEKCFRFNYVSEDNTARIRDDLYNTESGEIILHRTRCPSKESQFPAIIESTVSPIRPAELDYIIKDYQTSKKQDNLSNCHRLSNRHRCEIFSTVFFLEHLYPYLHREGCIIDMSKFCSNKTPSLRELLKFFLPDKKIAFYPSCGYTNWSKALNSDADLFIFAVYPWPDPQSANHDMRFLLTLLGQLDDDIIYENVLNEKFGSPDNSTNGHDNKWENFVRSAPVKIFGVIKTATANLFLWNRENNGGERQRQNVQWGILFFEDNNIVLDRIQRYGGQISFFIGIKDGCGEGGNYECVNEPPFFTKVLDCMADEGMTYISDHPLGRGNNFSSDFQEYYPDYRSSPQVSDNHGSDSVVQFFIQKNPDRTLNKEKQNEKLQYINEFVHLCEDLAKKIGDNIHENLKNPTKLRRNGKG